MLKYLHHVHYVVENCDEVVKYFEKSFGMKPDRIEINKGNNPAKEAYYQVDKKQVQVTEPITKTSDLAQHLAKHGPGVYHVAFAVENIEKLTADLMAAGNDIRRKKVDVSPRGYKSAHIEPTTSYGLGFQLIEEMNSKG